MEPLSQDFAELSEREVAGMDVCQEEEDEVPRRDQPRPVLDQLPVEILQHIGGFLEPTEIVESLSSTSSRLNEIFGNEQYWRIRIKNQWPASYPIIPDHVKQPAIWRHRCRDRETHFKLFKNAEKNMEKRIFGHGEGGLVGGDVNAVCFSKDGKLLCSGGRDRHVILWDLDAIKKRAPTDVAALLETGAPPNADFQSLLHTHAGWVWSLQSHGSLLSSGAWDCTINVSDLNHSVGAAAPKTTLKTTGSVTCHMWEGDRTIAGTFIGGVALFDTRAKTEPVFQKSQAHRHAVLGVHMENDRVILIGSDKKLQILDVRAGEFSIKKPIPNNDYGTQLCVRGGSVWVGTFKGHVLLYDQLGQELELVEDMTEAIGHSVGLKNQITGLHCDSGHILTCSMDRSAKMRQPTRKADLIWEHRADTGFTAMDFSRNNALALAWGPVVGIWWPKVRV